MAKKEWSIMDYGKNEVLDELVLLMCDSDEDKRIDVKGEIDLKITMNGKEIDVDLFMDRMLYVIKEKQKFMDKHIQEAAKELLDDRLSEHMDVMERFRSNMEKIIVNELGT